MLCMTWIARIGDGLPLAASIPEDEEVYCYLPARYLYKLVYLMLLQVSVLKYGRKAVKVT